MKNNNHFFIILCFILILNLIHSEASAVENNDGTKKSFSVDSLMKNTEVDLRINYGFFIHHHFEMARYPKHFPMFELSLQKQTYGKKMWQSYFNYPTVGVTAFYSSLGNNEVIGNAYAIYPFISYPFNKSKINTFGFRFGVGVGYITEIFHPKENFHNTSIGSHVNAAISLTFEYKRQISEHLKLSAFAGLTHFSNGCSSKPNNGLNIINAGLSASYFIKDQEEYIHNQKICNCEYRRLKPEFYLGLSYGIKRIEYGQKEDFSVYNLEIYILDRITNLSKIGIGLDLVSDATDKITLKNFYHDEDANNYTFAQLLKPGVSIAYELLMGETSFLINFGYHPWGRDMRYGRCYQKLGAKFNFGEHIYGKIALNTHFGVADFIGFGLGIRL